MRIVTECHQKKGNSNQRSLTSGEREREREMRKLFKCVMMTKSLDSVSCDTTTRPDTRHGGGHMCENSEDIIKHSATYYYTIPRYRLQ